ncbi:MAG: DUF2914 domain-containing protein [Deltaproteobacteria bacterium]|nr:DUF2914 domain-containing protein [Deltaproteobacteria bacterium]MBW2010391.1 DUF2914 domain-containing protein [Deltaproteobacteria bacterium]MBW2099155.1 DUF2914 domain-containing protein [Deltaproteobacteria bacterium]
MNKKTIEEADLKFVTKWNELRSSLAERRYRYENEPERSSFLPVVFIFIFVLFAVYGTNFFSKKQNPPQPEASKPIVPVDISVASTPSEKLMDTVCKNTLYPIPLPLQKTTAAAEDDGLSSTAPDPIEPVKPKTLENPTLTLEKLAANQKIKFLSIVPCKGVRNRQHLDKTTLFHISETIHPHIWMEVKSEKQPFVLKHVYYVNGEKYCEVPLDIRYPRMRTWSYITLKNPEHIGNWQVNVTQEDGHVLNRIHFEVIP